ncbi:MAG: toll/interleukin-1 receptor domain-containing protein, partial [Anaerolineales bacterium]|nr:toll/interleukin-1 receptor domain-containing protein [Anaerolineales bacterium]
MMPSPTNNHLLVQIHELLHKHFSLEEFRDLCFKLGIGYDDLAGEGLDAKMREFVARMDRESRLDDLLAFGTRLRPKVTWPEMAAPVSLEAAPTPPLTFTRNPNQIFLSHAHQDSDFAHRLAADLRTHGCDIWIAPDS